MSHRKWKHTDSHFTFEQLADALASRARWDSQVDELARAGHAEWNDHSPFDPLATESLDKALEEAQAEEMTP